MQKDLKLPNISNSTSWDICARTPVYVSAKDLDLNMEGWLLSQLWHVKSYLCMGWSRRTIAPRKKLAHSSPQFLYPHITRACKQRILKAHMTSGSFVCFCQKFSPKSCQTGVKCKFCFRFFLYSLVSSTPSYLCLLPKLVHEATYD